MDSTLTIPTQPDRLRRPCKFVSAWEKISNSTFPSHLPPGITILFGPSGAGKTTTAGLHCRAGSSRRRPNRNPGERPLRQCGGNQPSSAASQSGLCVSGPGAVSASDGPGQRRVRSLSASDRGNGKQRSAAILESFRIAHLRFAPARQISGGERQRVALARALVIDPDNPSAGRTAGGAGCHHQVEDCR